MDQEIKSEQLNNKNARRKHETIFCYLGIRKILRMTQNSEAIKDL